MQRLTCNSLPGENLDLGLVNTCITCDQAGFFNIGREGLITG